MNDKLISSKELLYNLKTFSVFAWSIEEHATFVKWAEDCINATPAVANEVRIRCKDCIHHEYIDGIIQEELGCKIWDKLLPENFFCGFADDGKEKLTDEPTKQTQTKV